MMTVKTPQDRKSKLDLTIKRPTKGVELCLDLSLRMQWEQAEVELREARKTPAGGRMLAGDQSQALAKKLTDLEAAMNEATIVFELTALKRRDWDQYKAAHPPRKGVKSDDQMGVDEETFYDAVMADSVLSVTDPDGAEVEWSHDSWGPLADEMTNAQYADFKLAILQLNVGEAAARLPKSLSASLVMARSDES